MKADVVTTRPDNTKPPPEGGGRRRWDPDELERALSEEALTAAAMQRYHVSNSIKRALGAKMGSLKEKAAPSEVIE